MLEQMSEAEFRDSEPRSVLSVEIDIEDRRNLE
jgi:hypothetical protein